VLGHNVRYTTSTELLWESTAALADGTLNHKRAAYSRLDLLLIDEFGVDLLERGAQARASTV
jgi:DNA replication protein DnaC